ncbi:uracil phosphoribosyltransferase [bacterium]|nr:uracil phosphoribosyltransferase [bacterium]
MRDNCYKQFTKTDKFINHELGDHVHIVDDVYAFSILAKLSSKETTQPMINIFVRELYKILLNHTITAFFPKVEKNIETRMKSYHQLGEFEATIIDPNTKVLVTDIARAGMIPGQICFDTLNFYLNPDNVIFDHIMASRDISVEQQKVNTVLAGLKITPQFSDGFILIPDPMGATGSSISRVINMYKEMHKNVTFITLHLIITPEYVRTMKEQHPDIHVISLRYDRGLSPQHVLDAPIGKFFDEEKSLTETKYILPGAGGLGEIINNNYV